MWSLITWRVARRTSPAMCRSVDARSRSIRRCSRTSAWSRCRLRELDGSTPSAWQESLRHATTLTGSGTPLSLATPWQRPSQWRSDDRSDRGRYDRADQCRGSCAPDRAFEVFTAGIDAWWTRAHHVQAGQLKEIGVDPQIGARLWETSGAGQTCTWGRVLTWNPPHVFALSWLIGPRLGHPGVGRPR